MFLCLGRYEWFQLFAHQLLWVVDVCGLWQIPSWERAAGGVGEQSRVSSCLHGAGTEAERPPQLTHTHKEPSRTCTSAKAFFFWLFWSYFRSLMVHIWLLICSCYSSHFVRSAVSLLHHLRTSKRFLTVRHQNGNCGTTYNLCEI